MLSESVFTASIAADTVKEMIEKEVISGGMIPKIECGLDAIDGGVSKAHIINGTERHALILELFTDEGVGTEVIK